MTIFDDQLAEAAALDPPLPTSPGGHPFPVPGSRARAVWLALTRHANSLDAIKVTAEQAMAAAQAAGAAPPVVDTYAASGTWTKRTGARWVQVVTIGSGESGAKVAGGRGGARSERIMPAGALPATVPVVVAAGPAGVSTSTNPNPGGTSSFGPYLSAVGGGQNIADSDEIGGQAGGNGTDNIATTKRSAGGGGQGANTTDKAGFRGGSPRQGGGVPIAGAAPGTDVGAPVSVSGTGFAGAGGTGGSGQAATLGRVGGAGGVPGGGGGGGGVGTTDYAGGGPGGRGEVVVITYF